VAEENRDPETYDPMKAMCMDQGQAKFDAQIKALVGRAEVESLLPQITCPTLVMTGELDTWSPPEQHRQIAAAIPNSELVIVPGAGHMILHEAPDAVNEAIARWLQMPVGGQISK
jgi:pimeloyl-ACP methyl ester carboxylesterase